MDYDTITPGTIPQGLHRQTDYDYLHVIVFGGVNIIVVSGRGISLLRGNRRRRRALQLRSRSRRATIDGGATIDEGEEIDGLGERQKRMILVTELNGRAEGDTEGSIWRIIWQLGRRRAQRTKTFHFWTGKRIDLLWIEPVMGADHGDQWPLDLQRFPHLRSAICADLSHPSCSNEFITSHDLSRDHRAAAEGWFAEESHNQAMRFGDLPEWAGELSNSIREAILFTNSGNSKEAIGVFPQDLLWREPLFDQLIANVYQPGEGICAHIDLMKFEDGIAIVSLESSCVMHFSRAESEEVCLGDNELHGSRSPSTKVPVLLTPGSMALMWGEARYIWKHEINRKQPLAVGFQEWQGRAITQQRRTSGMNGISHQTLYSAHTSSGTPRHCYKVVSSAGNI
ncbi:hypothetical protein DM860_004642 [Cuscuta australis]|uniref:Alpha-ketoglutarate-dependent dioxygenase AlkB-like domain-containing protein n=1 Tax=Cuscuta australis TaxID=267555 RepID=A0A328ECE8_9ASTE|nr:hypothetical protein DM860_004642 [Cuscuta australis]